MMNNTAWSIFRLSISHHNYAYVALATGQNQLLLLIKPYCIGMYLGSHAFYMEQTS